MRKHGKMAIRMAYEVVMPYHLHMPSYFLETFTEYPKLEKPSLESTQKNERKAQRKNINAMTSNIHCFFPHYNK